MELYLSHTSALEALRIAGACSRRSARGFSLCAPMSDDLRRLADAHLAWLSFPVHLLVPHAGARTKSGEAICHVLPKGLPVAPFVRIRGGVWAVPPEMLFVQLASVLSLVRLIEVACELCGGYRLANNERGYVKAPPVTSIAKLEEYVGALHGIVGAKQARRALGFAREGSRSPMETTSFLLASLPQRLGGYGTGHPLLNARIDVPPSKRGLVAKSCYYCDLYWPEARLALEYDSDECHTGTEHIFGDSSRRADLALLGVEVVTLTRLQVMQADEFDKVMALVEKRLGKRGHPAGQEWRRKRAALRRELLDFSRRGRIA